MDHIGPRAEGFDHSNSRISQCHVRPSVHPAHYPPPCFALSLLRPPQDVSDLELKLSEKSQMIEDLQTQVNRLQAELMVNQHQIGNQLAQQSDLQKQLDTLQRAEQVTRVTLEVIGARVIFIANS